MADLEFDDAGYPHDRPEDDDEPRGDDNDTACRHCNGSELCGHEPDCIYSVLGSQNQHVDMLEQDLATAKARVAELEAPALKVTLEPFCTGCGKEIDPDTCGCGSAMTSYGHDNHSPIPMGCSCLRHAHTDEDRLRGLRERLHVVMERVRAAGVVIVEECSR